MYGNRAKQNNERKRFKEEIGILDIKRKRFFTSYNIKKYESEKEYKESDYEKGKFLPNQCYFNNLNNILITKYNMAKMLFQKKKYDESLEAYKELFTIQKHFSSLGPSHPDTLTTMKNIAFILAKQKKYDKALKVYKELFTMQKHFSSLGPSHPDTLTTMKNIAFVLAEQKEYDKALKVYKEVLSIQKDIFLDPDHPDIKQTESSIVIMQQKYECIKELDHSIRGILNSIKKLFCAKKQENCLQAKFYPKEKNNNIRSYGNEKLFLESVPNSTLIIDNIQTTKKLLIYTNSHY